MPEAAKRAVHIARLEKLFAGGRRGGMTLICDDASNRVPHESRAQG